MNLIIHAEQETVDWRPGVATRMIVSAVTGSSQLCIFEQRCDPGLGAPMHMHVVEEVLDVISGTADVWVGDQTVSMSGGNSLIVPAGVLHGFRNTSATDVLYVRATLALPIFEASYENRTDESRRYVPES